MFLNILYSFLGSALLAATVLFIYYRISKYYSKITICSDCYWIPKFNCWKYVIKNFSSTEPFYSVRYRAWISKVAPTSPLMVAYINEDLSEGRRSIISILDNLPVLCFRIEHIKNQVVFFLTDQFGTTLKAYPDISEYTFINIDYQLKIIKLGIFKFEINRQYSIPTNNDFDSCQFHVPNLIDYEKFQDDKEKRKNFFSKQAEIFSSVG